MIRKMSVAGSFYPDKKDDILNFIDNFNSTLNNKKIDFSILEKSPKTIIVPHAGYIYSGFTANMAYRALSSNKSIKHIVVIGPSHRVYLEDISLGDFNEYATPIGNIKADEQIKSLLASKGLKFYPAAHEEHSTEVQFPFIKNYFPKAKITELVYGKVDYLKISNIIDILLKIEECAVVISTDLSHFYNLHKANQLDSICLNAIQDLNIKELDNGCEACGLLGIKAILHSAKNHDLSANILDYKTSADVSGDTNRVVGYTSVQLQYLPI